MRRAITSDAVAGRIHGGSAQGIGLALMEETEAEDGRIRAPSSSRPPSPSLRRS
ncbi:molybdopterin cofactor-binding domain-containing protein [Streptomyces sp. NBC_00557]|uniref:molybdopterin cofactor-binding domain-containing protein n=1 Tax=Streptomyces sp. NBC_00557 TaxID=2975776 RepID=UPI002E80E0F8|nr:molybdopterin cofactor-binding domain-containing protein [Streptomyces sp. NBC_00557]WUC35050.1 molybdopterin-dependent oxidoreductase [Streptomyces sp. NBC_00557]